MSNFITGIEIGSSKISGAVGKLDKFGKLQIIGITSVECLGIKKAVVADIDSTADSISNCLKQLERMVDIEIKQTYISLPGGICNIIYNKAAVAISSDDRDIKDTDVKRVLDAAKVISISQDKEIVGIVPQQFIVDGYPNIKDPVGMSGSRLEVDAQVITSSGNIISNLFKSFNRSGIKIEGMVLQPLAASDVVLRREDIEMGAALVDVGAETTTISIFKNGNLCFSEMFALGGNNITNDISLCLKIPLNEAERIKIKYGNISKVSEINETIKVNNLYNSTIEVSCQMLSDIISARVEEILSFVYKKLQMSGYYNEISGITLIGGGIALLKGITEASREIIGKNTKIGSPEYVGAASPIYAGCIGILKDAADNLKERDFQESNSRITEDRLTGRKVKKEVNDESLLIKVRKFLGDFF